MAKLIWIMAALGDIIIIGACAIIIYLEPKNPIVWLVVVFAFKTWYENGRFMVWHPVTIREFFANAKKYGL